MSTPSDHRPGSSTPPSCNDRHPTLKPLIGASINTEVVRRKNIVPVGVDEFVGLRAFALSDYRRWALGRLERTLFTLD